MLGCIQPISSAMMNRILGFALVVACACARVTSPASKRLEMASAPTAIFRTSAPKSMVNLLLHVLLVGLHEGGGLRRANINPSDVAIGEALVLAPTPS